MMPRYFDFRPAWAGATLVLALGAALLARWGHLPLPWLLGPLFGVALLRMAGLPLEALRGGRQAGQWAIGTALGLHFTPLVVGRLGQEAPLILALALGGVLAGLLGGWILARWGRVNPATAFFAALPGGASEMVVLAERGGGAPDRVAAAHGLRVLLVVSTIPFILYHWAPASPATPLLHGPEATGTLLDLAGLIALAWVGAGVLGGLKVANFWVLGPMASVGLATALGCHLPLLPGWAVNGGQLLLGAALGTRFTPEFFSAAPRFLSISALSTFCALALGGLGVMLLQAAGWGHWPTLTLAASPGGMAEMCLTAEVLGLGVPLVTATHVLRVVLMTVCAPRLCGLFVRWVGARG